VGRLHDARQGRRPLVERCGRRDARLRTGARDGRWYHPVVAELANSAWLQKMQQRYDTEKSRIKQHNIRHGTKVPYPVWEEWFAGGCVTGQPLPTTPSVAGDTPAPPPPPVTGDKVGTPPPPVTGDTPPLSPVTSAPRERERDRDRTPNTFPPAPSAPPPPPPDPAPTPTPAPPPKPRRTPAPTTPPAPDEDRPTNRAWRAYAAAFAERYGVEPERNQQTNGQLATLLRKVTADDVPFVIDFYVRHKTTRYYLDRRHTIDDFVRDYHGIRTHWAQLQAGQAADRVEAQQTPPSPRAARMAAFAGSAAAGAPRQQPTPRPALGDVTDVESRDVKSSN
jgi:hypothetical protein